MNHKSVLQGRTAERRAEQFLKRNGYETLERNLHVGRDEIDLVMRAPDSTTIVIVEVKSSRLGSLRARKNLSKKKCHRVARALRYLEARGILDGHHVRIDAIFIDTSQSPVGIEHLTGMPLRPARAKAASNGEGRSRRGGAPSF